MDYSLLAGQLLSVQANLLQVPAYQQLSKMVRGELFVLNYLATHKTAIHPKELSKKMAVSTARVTFLLHHMEEKGLIARSSDLSDNRQIFVRLTENGVNAIQKARRRSSPGYRPCWKHSAPRTPGNISAFRKRFWTIFWEILKNHFIHAGSAGSARLPRRTRFFFGTMPTFSSVHFGISVLY